MHKTSKLSIIIPAYNEGKVIRKTLHHLMHSMRSFSYPYEVLVVADGCKDDTVAKAKECAEEHLTVLSYAKNHGKGFAIKYGIKHATGDIITFYDAGGDFDATHIDRFIKLMEVFDADIVIGSKRHPASHVNYPFKRRIFSWIYHKLVNLMFGLHVSDTQTGMKVIKRDVALKIFPRLVVKQYAFDLEMLVVAKVLGYKRIFEAPVNLEFNSVSSGINWRTTKKMIQDTVAIFYRCYLLNYYNRPIRYHMEKSQRVNQEILEREKL